MAVQPVRIFWGDLKSGRKKEALRRDRLLLHAAAHFFEQNAFVRGVLIDQDQAAGVFHQDVEPSQDSDDFEVRTCRAGRGGWRRNGGRNGFRPGRRNGSWRSLRGALNHWSGPIAPQCKLFAGRNQFRLMDFRNRL